MLENNNYTKIANDLEQTKEDLQKEEDEFVLIECCLSHDTHSVRQACGDVHAVVRRGPEGPRADSGGYCQPEEGARGRQVQDRCQVFLAQQPAGDPV